MKKIIYLALLLCFSATTITSAQSKPSQKEIFASTYHSSKTAIKAQQYQFVGLVVYNNKERQRLEADSNTLKIESDNISGTLSSLGTYTFLTDTSKNKITNYKASFNDDAQEIVIEFNVGEAKFHINVKANGNAFLTLKSGVNNITQTGKIERI
ncbi:hypothetical protein VDP25_09565 [Winogradskyella sp. ECml5-4]|uniref:hypothetical protein n=1 Tax=Winogradskyella sp. ECml5-4 TaxID=3110975 RepID=UPI002FF2AE96